MPNALPPMPPRPWHLQILEKGEWATWSTYREERIPLRRAGELAAKGQQARVVNVDTAELVEVCPHCDLAHDGPTDGTCLL